MSRVCCEVIDCQNEGTLRCSACKLVLYCHSRCQRKDWQRHKMECRNIQDNKEDVRTEVCGYKTCQNKGNLKCSNCLLESYCHEDCQRKDWKQHKLICKKRKTRAELDSMMPSRGVEENRNIPDCIEMMGDLFNSVMGKQFGIQIERPKYHLEYNQAYPNDKDTFKKIFGTYKSSTISLVMNTSGDFGDQLQGFGSLAQILRKRWMCFGPLLIDYLNGRPQPGTICPVHPSVFKEMEYGSQTGSNNKVFHMMRNTPVYMKLFEPGNHVSVGFVDLIQLLYADISAEEGTVKWYGFEMNVILVARAKLILTLLVNQTIPDHLILQIWFSSLISSEAANIVIQTCLFLSQTEGDENVKDIFVYWSKSRLSCKMAKTLWSARIGSSVIEALEVLSSKQDRVFYARYIFHGELFIGSSSMPSCGNSTLLCIPTVLQDSHTRDWDNVFFSFAAGLFYQNNLEYSIESKLSAGVENLRKALLGKKLIVSIHLENITLTNTTALNLIKDLDPLTIDWSNVPEYIHSDIFHRILRHVSSSNTKHSAHFMNWHTAVYGTNPIDFIQIPITTRMLGDLNNVNMTPINQLGKRLMTEKKQFLRNVLTQFPFLQQDPDLHVLNFMTVANEVLSHPFKEKYIDFYFHRSDDVKAQLIIEDPAMNRINPFSVQELIHVSFKVVNNIDSLRIS